MFHVKQWDHTAWCHLEGLGIWVPRMFNVLDCCPIADWCVVRGTESSETQNFRDMNNDLGGGSWEPLVVVYLRTPSVPRVRN